MPRKVVKKEPEDEPMDTPRQTRKRGRPAAIVESSDEEEEMEESPGPRKRSTTRPSISGGILPTDSARVRPSATGQPRFRFKNSRTIDVVTDLSGWDDYRGAVEKTKLDWDKEHRQQKLPAILSAKTSDWTRNGELPCEISKKTSVGVNFHDNTGAFVQTATLPVDLTRLKSFESTSKTSQQETANWVSMAYATGPVHTLKFAPNSLADGEEVLMVVAYPDDEELVAGNWRECSGFVQFWLVRPGKEETDATVLLPWFLLETAHGAVLNANWLDFPRSELDQKLLGHVVVATAQGTVLIYRIDTDSVPRPSEEGAAPPTVAPEPLVILRQEPPSTEEVQIVKYPPPITRVDWTILENARYVAGINAAGAVCVWDLEGDVNTPRMLKNKDWTSPAVDLCFVKEHEIVVAFRERLVRVYDIRDWSLLMEESTPRTAGTRVISSPRLLSGFMTFQAEYYAGTAAPTTGIAYVCSDDITSGYFVVPLANRHEMQLWDASISPSTAILATCGADGQLLISGNGRVAPRRSKADSSFSVIHTSMLISKRRLEEPVQEGKVLDGIFNYKELCEKTWLEVSLQPKKDAKDVPYSSLELRTQSLNVVAMNSYSERPIVVTAGQAGLLFVRPCRLDMAANSAHPLELISALTTARGPPPPKKRRGRPPIKKEPLDEE